MLNDTLFQNVQKRSVKILIVTKYWNTNTTAEIYKLAQKQYPEIIYGLGENRIESIVEKQLPRNLVHFIGNIQSQKIRQIVQRC